MTSILFFRCCFHAIDERYSPTTFGSSSIKNSLRWCFLFVTLFNLQGTRRYLRNVAILSDFSAFVKHFFLPFSERKNQVLNAHNFSLLVLSNFDKPIWPPSYPMVGSLCIFLFSSPCSALLTPSPFECPLCWFLPVTRSVRSLAGTPGT